jgi:hypothetical protein
MDQTQDRTSLGRTVEYKPMVMDDVTCRWVWTSCYSYRPQVVRVEVFQFQLSSLHTKLGTLLLNCSFFSFSNPSNPAFPIISNPWPIPPTPHSPLPHISFASAPDPLHPSPFSDLDDTDDEVLVFTPASASHLT